jgi:hypothetical protein
MSLAASSLGETRWMLSLAMSQMASYDAASNICPETNGIL